MFLGFSAPAARRPTGATIGDFVFIPIGGRVQSNAAKRPAIWLGNNRTNLRIRKPPYLFGPGKQRPTNQRQHPRSQSWPPVLVPAASLQTVGQVLDQVRSFINPMRSPAASWLDNNRTNPRKTSSPDKSWPKSRPQ